jgi:hypothetical protein
MSSTDCPATRSGGPDRGGSGVATFRRHGQFSVSCASRWKTDGRDPHHDDIMRVAGLLRRPVGEVWGWAADAGINRGRNASCGAWPTPAALRARSEPGGPGPEVGVDPDTLGRWERGARPMPVWRLDALARAASPPHRRVATRNCAWQSAAGGWPSADHARATRIQPGRGGRSPGYQQRAAGSVREYGRIKDLPCQARHMCVVWHSLSPARR